jgi:hypothetical protein
VIPTRRNKLARSLLAIVLACAVVPLPRAAAQCAM